jgi:putative ABC transport system permease protein
MTPKSCFWVALRALTKNKLQTGLTMIGLTIGVATVLTMIAVGSGAQSAIQDQVKAAGMNSIMVSSGNHSRQVEDENGVIDDSGNPGSPSGMLGIPTNQAALFGPAERLFQPAVYTTNERPRFILAADTPDAKGGNTVSSPATPAATNAPSILGMAATLTLDDANAIRDVRGVQFVSEDVHANITLQNGNSRAFTHVHGAGVDLPKIRRAWIFPKGRYFSRGEQSDSELVVVLGSIVAEKLFGKEDAVGKTINLWDQPFKIVGVVGTGSWLVGAAQGDDQFDAVYIPFKTFHRVMKFSTLNEIAVTAASSGEVTRIVKNITELLRKRHNVTRGQQDDFTVTSQARKALSKGGMRPEVARAVVGNMNVLEGVTLEQLSKTLERASSTMTALLACVAGVSLLVGGIGIMNVMLLSVTERTREIGIRRAVGAKSKDVLMQFLMEATTLSLLGGVAGILIGVAISMAISRWASWSAEVSGLSIALSFGVAAAVGIFFGYYPARRASEVAPMESLRYE